MDISPGRLNVFQNYSEFLQQNNEKSANKSKNFYGVMDDQFIDDMCTDSDIDKILKTKFDKKEYPADLASFNIFCPICGRFVKPQQLYSMYQSLSYKRRFIAHDACLSQQSTRFLNDYFDQVQQMTLSPCERQNNMKSLQIGDRQFCLQLVLTHPLSDFKFIKLVSKVNLNGNTLRWQFRQQYEPFCYLPNMICFPYIDFKLTLIISEINSNNAKKKINNYINLSKIKFDSTKSIVAKYQQMNLWFNIYSQKKEKQEIIQAMNFKYMHPLHQTLPIIQLSALQVQIPEQEFEDYLENNSNSTIVQLLSEKVQQSSFASSMSMYSATKKMQDYDQNLSSNGLIRPKNFAQPPLKQQKLSACEKQKVDFQKLISTGKLSSYVRNSTQSRIFQNFLDEATPQQIEIIICSLYDQFPELVVDQYANYMTQKLFQVCSPNQRLHILTKLSTHLPSLVKNKQGTHTIQLFTTLFTLDEELKLVVQNISQQFEQLCYNSISTHFIQKIIKIFPLEATLKFYYIANHNFLKFATDKNAMCVLKYMLRRIKQNEQNNLVFQIKKNFINSITLNTDKIIQDCYGNYVVQFCYQLFGQNKSSGITQMILQKFVQFSLQKYSSSVVSKCINTYWNDKGYVNKLKDNLKTEGVLQMYRNRQGNKILLQLMDKNENTSLRQKINNILSSNGEPSKFYHERWGLQIGIRSGPVGFEFKSFSQADTQLRGNKSTTSKKSKKK